MALSSAEKQRAFRQRQKERMAVDPEYAAEVRARKAAEDKKYYEKADKKKLTQQSNQRYHRRYKTDEEFRQRRLREAAESYQRHRTARLVKKQEWRENNKDSIAAYMVEWDKNNRDKRQAINAKRRALQSGSKAEQISKSEVWTRDSGICGICREPANPDEWHLDHIIPLSRGGPHVFENVQVSHPRCNLSKSNKILSEV